MIVALMASALIPSLLLVWYFTSRDVYPEPRRVVWATFFLGVLVILPTLVVVLPIGWVVDRTVEQPYLKGLADAFLTAAIPEELLEFLGSVPLRRSPP